MLGNRKHCKQNGRQAKNPILLLLLPVIAAYQCHGVLLCYLLISLKRQQVAMLNAAMEYSKALARIRHVKKKNYSARAISKKTRPHGLIVEELI